MAGIVAESLYGDQLDPEVRKRLHKAMHVACMGNAKREGDWHGDDMWPSYSNVGTTSRPEAHHLALVPPLRLLSLCG